MNFIFISPVFPENYYMFCKRLKENNVNVLAIADTPYDMLSFELKNSVTEYYKVNSLENYDEMYKAVAYFAFKYGKIDFLESNNEYWLRQDAKLRLDFNIYGPKFSDVECFTSKSKMKTFYELANIKTAKYKFCTNINEDLKFISTVGFPVIVKPDIGVGANKTYKISNEHDLLSFYNEGISANYIIEEYIDGDIISLDGVCDKNGNIVFCDNECFPSIADVVNDRLELSYYVNKETPKYLSDIAQRVLKAFNIKTRFFHLEFFKLKADKENLGKKGDIVALEVNMRPPGGYTPDLINFSQSFDCYKIWADIIAFDKTNEDLFKEKYYAMSVSRRNHIKYFYSHDEIINKYSTSLVKYGNINEAYSNALGDYYYMARFTDYSEMIMFKNYILKK